MTTLPTHPLPLTNCHIHTFTGNHVPPWLAKTFLPWPFYYLFSVPLLVKIFKWYYRGIYRWQFKGWYKKWVRAMYKVWTIVSRSFILSAFKFVAGLLLTIHVFYILWDSIRLVTKPNSTELEGAVAKTREWLVQHHILYPFESLWLKVGLIVLLLLIFPVGINLILSIFKRVFKILGVLPGKQTKQLAERYLNIGRFAFYEGQSGIFDKAQQQYPNGSRFVILPMDMEYMGAGKPTKTYEEQMKGLKAVKEKVSNQNLVFPFIFAEPRRMAEDKKHFQYHIVNEKVVLGDCFMKEYLETNGFKGIKMYPALGYFPFDEQLLPLYKYAADHKIPVLTHCIRGTIFYRGTKQKAWDFHPVFKQAMGDKKYEKLLLPERKNKDFINNFTHPLNYLCLLDDSLLAILIGQSNDPKLRQLFGYDEQTKKIANGLGHLKLCFGHYGGEDEWVRYFESDRDNYSKELISNPQKGIEFLCSPNGELAPGKPEQIWKYVDWYSIISSLMLQFPNVYADISYILHVPEIQPLLKQTLTNPKLREKVLFGTDFYVVRNHKSEKNMVAEMIKQLSEQEFDQIARVNPDKFLKTI